MLRRHDTLILEGARISTTGEPTGEPTGEHLRQQQQDKETTRGSPGCITMPEEMMKKKAKREQQKWLPR